MIDGKQQPQDEPLEQRIRRVTLGEPEVLDGPVTLVEYDPEWPNQFTREAERVCAALGKRALQIEHVGSTSVPGLVAKAIIDILLVVPDSADEPSYVPQLERAGYLLRIREPEWQEHRLFRRRESTVNLHVFTAGSAEVGRLLLFRDHLRRSAEDRELYARTKQQLAARTWKYVQEYADAKSDIIEMIIAREHSLR